MHVRVLGCSGAIAQHARTTSFLVNGQLLVDAGTGVGDLTLSEMVQIEDVLLTHVHLDHIVALPLLLDSVGARRRGPLRVYALPETLAALRTHVFNDLIWPDFSRLPSPDAPFVVFHALSVGQQLSVSGVNVEVLPAVHTVPAVGYALSPDGLGASQWVFSGDTGHNPAFWTRVNQLSVGVLVIETAFSDREAGLAAISQHLCPRMLGVQLDMMRPEVDCPIFITHTKPSEAAGIMQEVSNLNEARQAKGLKPWRITWLKEGQEWVL